MEPFDGSRVRWEHMDNPMEFWLIQMSHANALGRLALHIFSTPANYVSSERAFPIQNIIKTKQRNALHPDRVNKLMFIYMNSPIIKASSQLQKPQCEADEVELGQQLLKDEELHVQRDSEDSEDEEDLDINAIEDE